MVNKGVLYAKRSTDDLRYVIPKKEIITLIKTRHCMLHFSSRKLRDILLKICFWSQDTGAEDNMKETVDEITNCCKQCNFFSKNKRIF